MGARAMARFMAHQTVTFLVRDLAAARFPMSFKIGLRSDVPALSERHGEMMLQWEVLACHLKFGHRL